MVRGVMAAAGCNPALYGAHSLRIGGATAALATLGMGAVVMDDLGESLMLGFGER